MKLLLKKYYKGKPRVLVRCVKNQAGNYFLCGEWWKCSGDWKTRGSYPLPVIGRRRWGLG